MWETFFALMVLVVVLCVGIRGGASRSGYGVNDSRRWEGLGGTLKRPPPPSSFRPK